MSAGGFHSAPPGLTPNQWAVVREILRAHAPPRARIWMFGSRAKGTAGKGSDLDLAVDNQGRPLTLAEAGRLDLAFEESPLPWRVDVADWNAVSPEFRRRIADARAELAVGTADGRKGAFSCRKQN